MASKKVIIFKVVHKTNSVYTSLRDPACYYALDKDTFEFRCGLYKGI
ncbi:MAG: hypothetical protein ACFFC7_16155 [Candidatus Hermodarchaeota archaeon]